MPIELTETRLGDSDFEYTPAEGHPQHGRTYRVTLGKPRFAKAESNLQEWSVVSPEGRVIGRTKTLDEAHLVIRRNIVEYATQRRRPDG